MNTYVTFASWGPVKPSTSPTAACAGLAMAWTTGKKSISAARSFLRNGMIIRDLENTEDV